VKPKIRLDNLLLSRDLVISLNQAAALIMSGHVLVDEMKINKCGQIISTEAKIRILKKIPKYVSRGGEKLEGAHKSLNFEIKDKVALDIGISTGGFTDYLLQNEAKLVFGVDVSYGIVDNKIRTNKKVVLIERKNARYLSKEDLEKSIKKRPEILPLLNNISLVVMDVSFISVTKILPIIKELVSKDADYIILIKPQFEAPRELVGEKGIIKDPQIQQEIINTVEQKLASSFKLIKKCPSPIQGTKGNKEFFFCLKGK
jgi:23S rRNA (cytidine1920-2'-O)/16S rRNA (cytidine1409-2'-O)-methyltransferase